MSLIKPAALFVCVALAGCAGKSDPVDPLAKDSPVAKDKPVAEVQKPESKPAAEQQGKQATGSGPAKGAGVSGAAKDAKPAQAAARPLAKVAEQKAVKEKESSWWSFGGKKEERVVAEDKGAKPAQMAAKSEAKAAEQKAAKEEEGSWWSFGDKKKEVAQAAPGARKAEARKVTPAWLDDHEKRLKEAVAGSKFQVERRGDVLVVVAPVDSSFNPDRPSMLMPITLGPLSRVAKLVAADPQNAVLILGHGDSNGKTEDGRKLSLERAQSVASIFRMSGLKNDRLMLRGLGADKPLVSNDNAKGRAQNRRVEVILTLRDSLPTLVAQNSR